MPQIAAADTVFTSFGPGDAVDGSTPFPLSGGQAVAQAVEFVPSAGFSVTQVQAALRATGGAGPSTLFVTIVPDVAGSALLFSGIWTLVVMIFNVFLGVTALNSFRPVAC
jgi:hypothetical protein